MKNVCKERLISIVEMTDTFIGQKAADLETR